MSTSLIWADSAQDLIAHIKSDDLVNMVLLLQRMDLEELEANDPFTRLTPLVALVSEAPTPARLLALQLFLFKGVTRSVLSALDRAKEYKNDAAVDLLGKWAWGKKEDASWLTAMLTMNEKELATWVTDQEMELVVQQEPFDGPTQDLASSSASHSKPAAVRQLSSSANPNAGQPSASGFDAPFVQPFPLPGTPALLPHMPSPAHCPDFPNRNAGIASLPSRPAPMNAQSSQSTQSRKRPSDVAFAPLPRLVGPPPSAFSADPTIFTIHGLPHGLGVNKKEIFELLKSHGAEKLDVREVKMTGVKAPKDEKGKRIKDSRGKQLGGTLKVEIEFQSSDMCHETGSSLDGTLWRGVKVEVEWTKRNAKKKSSFAPSSTSWCLPPASAIASDHELTDTPSRVPRLSVSTPFAADGSQILGEDSFNPSNTRRRVVDYSDLWG